MNFRPLACHLKKRGERADEYLKVLNEIWYNYSVEFQGKYYSIPKSVVGPKTISEKKFQFT